MPRGIYVRTPETIAKCGTYTRTPEIRAKMSASHMGQKPWNTGKRYTPELCEKLSVAHKGRRHTQEQRIKRSNAMKIRMADPIEKTKLSNSMRGRKMPQETRDKLSAALMGRFCGEEGNNWRGGISFEPYCPKFNNYLRLRIRAFFDNRCVLCGKTKEENVWHLSCHHVEYNKQACCDGKPVQFATLCKMCHGRTNHENDRWEAMLHRIIDEIYGGRSYFTKDEWEAAIDREMEKVE